jgi:hypothetical protein
MADYAKLFVEQHEDWIRARIEEVRKKASRTVADEVRANIIECDLDDALKQLENPDA